MKINAANTRKRGERGFTILEMLFATIILTICSVGLLTVLAFSVARNSGQDQSTRSTEYAQDKMEQLMALAFNDTTSDVAGVFPTVKLGGACPNGLNPGGGVDPSNVVNCYVDYVDGSGIISRTATGAVYKRQWKVVNEAGGGIKTITVLVTPPPTVLAPSTMLISQRESF